MNEKKEDQAQVGAIALVVVENNSTTESVGMVTDDDDEKMELSVATTLSSSSGTPATHTTTTKMDEDKDEEDKDPRMLKALEAKLKRPQLSFAAALKIGGYRYPHRANSAAKDDENVTLSDRKNVLNRKIRKTRMSQYNQYMNKQRQEEGAEQQQQQQQHQQQPHQQQQQNHNRQQQNHNRQQEKEEEQMSRTIEREMAKLDDCSSNNHQQKMTQQDVLPDCPTDGLLPFIDEMEEAAAPEIPQPLPLAGRSGLFSTSDAALNNSSYGFVNTTTTTTNNNNNFGAVADSRRFVSVVGGESEGYSHSRSHSTTSSLSSSNESRTTNVSAAGFGGRQRQQQQQQQQQQHNQQPSPQFQQQQQQITQGFGSSHSMMQQALNNFERGVSSLYQQAMLQAGFSYDDVQESSDAYRTFALKCGEQEFHRLQYMMWADRNIAPPPNQPLNNNGNAINHQYQQQQQQPK